MDNLERLGNSISVPISADEDGFLGRECPNESCLGYFKIMPGTGLPGEVPCHCPYCGHKAAHDCFWTQDQIEYAYSVAIREVEGAVVKDLKAMEFDHKPKGDFGIGISFKVKESSPAPLHMYREKELETRITCSSCTLQYAVYGVFAFCPDCGKHNSLQILEKNFDVIEKLLALAQGLEEEVSSKLLENALIDCVSAFDGFGREICKVNRDRAAEPDQAENISFQNLDRAEKKCLKLFNISLREQLDNTDWQQCKDLFEKRHLFAHKMGVADDKYIKPISDKYTASGRKVEVDADEVTCLGKLLRKIAKGLLTSFDSTPTQDENSARM